MGIDLNLSETKKNLMRAFAGESQARNRYTIGADKAKHANLPVIEAVFSFTANQEREHAEIYFNYLKEFSGEDIQLDGAYPVEVSDSILKLLRFAERDEYKEYSEIYKNSGDKALEEGFPAIANSFHKIAAIEKTHSERFKMFADWMEQDKLFVSDVECYWMCLKCGYIYKGTNAPLKCPVCHNDQGYFIRLELAPYTK